MAAMHVTGVIAAVVAVGVVLAGMSLHLARGMNALRRDLNGRMDALARDMADLRVRMARIEGLFTGFMAWNATDARRVRGQVETLKETRI